MGYADFVDLEGNLQLHGGKEVAGYDQLTDWALIMHPIEQKTKETY